MIHVRSLRFLRCCLAFQLRSQLVNPLLQLLEFGREVSELVKGLN